MVFWLILALMTAAAMTAVMWPLWRSGRAARSGSEVAVYRDQLEELERDVRAGLIGKAEAEAARVEIARRLLAAADAENGESGPGPVAVTRRRRVFSAVALFLLPIGAGGLYFWTGSPNLAGEALSVRRDTSFAGQPSVANLVARVEVHLQNNPEDGTGWEVLAPVYMQLGRYRDSAKAWQNAMWLLGESVERQVNLGEALVAEANGIVTGEAKTAFMRAAVLDKTAVRARYYLGIAAEQDGNREEAAQLWRDLIAEAPAGAHWVDEVRAAVARVKGQPAASPGPSAAQMAAAAQQSPDEQSAMIRGMVEGLAARLKLDGSDLEGWVKLVRAYKVLGEQGKAQTAIDDARLAFTADPDKRQQLDRALQQLETGMAASAATSNQQGREPVAPPQHESAAIQSMIDRLAERLKTSRLDVEGWVMLTRSYVTLDERGKAAAAVKDARAALADDSARLKLFDEALQRFKIGDLGSAPSGK